MDQFRSRFLGQVRLGQPMDTSIPTPPPQQVIQCKAGADCPVAACLTVGPISAPDLKKVREFSQAKPSGSFWIYPKTTMGPGDQDYVVWCNAYATPVAGAVAWVPPDLINEPIGTSGNVTPPITQPASVPTSPTQALPNQSLLPVAAGLGVVAILAVGLSSMK